MLRFVAFCLVSCCVADFVPCSTQESKPFRPLHIIEADDGRLQWVAFSTDDRHVASCGDRFVQMFDVKTGKLVRRFAGHSEDIFRFAFSPNGQWLLQVHATKRYTFGTSKTVTSSLFFRDTQIVSSESTLPSDRSHPCTVGNAALPRREYTPGPSSLSKIDNRESCQDGEMSGPHMLANLIEQFHNVLLA